MQLIFGSRGLAPHVRIFLSALRTIPWYVLVGVILLSTAACGGGDSSGGSEDDSGTSDVTAPIGSASPGSSGVLAETASVTISWNEPMDTTSLVLGTGGDHLSAQSDGGTWSNEQTLAIAPGSTWGEATGQTLIVDAKDKAGNVAATLTLTYDVDATAPSVDSVVPTSGTYVVQSTQVTIVFDESMAPSSLALTGDMGGEASASWSETAAPNDTLTLSAASAWGLGVGRTLNVSATDVAGHAVPTQNLAFSVDGGAPTVVVSPSSGTAVDQAGSIVLTFSEGMNTGSLSLTGTLSAEGTGNWTTTTNTNDTLTVTPTSNWSTGSGKTLTVNVDDLAGFAAPSQSLTFHVLDGNVYVHPSGDDGNPGTSDLPKATIQAGIDVADAVYDTATVKVAEGTYAVDPQAGTGMVLSAGTTITLAPGISVLGGYDATNWVNRNTETYPTLIVPQDQSGYAVLADGASITRSSVLNGFTVSGDQAAYSTDDGGGVLIRNGASPEVSQNTISISRGDDIHGVRVENGGNPLVELNSFTGPSDTTTRAHGVYVLDASPDVISNTIDLPLDDSKKIGIYFEDATGAQAETPLIDSNTITVSHYGIQVWGGNATSTPTLSGNTISTSNLSGNGIVCSWATCIIDGNTVDGPTKTIYLYNSSAVVTNNLLLAHAVSGVGMVMWNGGIPVVRNNTIYAGGATGIGILNAVYPFIENNLIMVAYVGGYAIQEGASTSIASSIKNNLLFATYAYRASTDRGCAVQISIYSHCTVAELEAGGGIDGLFPASGNVNTDPLLTDLDGADNDLTTMADNDWHLSGSTPTSVSQGGLNGVDQAWSFTDDYDGVTRPASGSPWAIGGFEL